jgi:hypothetical protein
MNEKLTLNDGTELNGHVRETLSGLYVYTFGAILADVFAVMNDLEKTKVIKSEENGAKKTIRGYKHLRAISEEMGGMICTVLTK